MDVLSLGSSNKSIIHTEQQRIVIMNEKEKKKTHLRNLKKKKKFTLPISHFTEKEVSICQPSLFTYLQINWKIMSENVKVKKLFNKLLSLNLKMFSNLWKGKETLKYLHFNHVLESMVTFDSIVKKNKT